MFSPEPGPAVTVPAATPSKLIYDVGVENGDDSAYYLRLGYCVVGIEANPMMLPALRQRFATELAESRYCLVPMGIAATAGTAPFWICDDEPGRSSFDRFLASSFGARHHSITVETCTFRSVLDRFGRAAYVKCDIEGSDDLCLRDIEISTRPDFISVEVTRGERQIARLCELGYTRFKFIAQSSFRQPNWGLEVFRRKVPPWTKRLIDAAERKLTNRRSEKAWRSAFGPSGPFGEETRGKWLDARQALALNRVLDVSHEDAVWYDIHAGL